MPKPRPVMNRSEMKGEGALAVCRKKRTHAATAAHSGTRNSGLVTWPLLPPRYAMPSMAGSSVPPSSATPRMSR